MGDKPETPGNVPETSSAATSSGPHRDDVLLAKLLRVRARLELIDGHTWMTLSTELRLLDEVIEELTNDA